MTSSRSGVSHGAVGTGRTLARAARRARGRGAAVAVAAAALLLLGPGCLSEHDVSAGPGGDASTEDTGAAADRDTRSGDQDDAGRGGDADVAGGDGADADDDAGADAAHDAGADDADDAGGDAADDAGDDAGAGDAGGDAPVDAAADAAAEPDADVPACAPPPAVFINEVVASNQTGFVDEDGDTPDWIELYNAGDEPVSLGGWGLSDDAGEPFRWLLPDRTLEPGELLLILASGKDRRSLVAAWDTRVDRGDPWRYLPVVAELDPGWVGPDFSDLGWAEGPSGFGHSDGDDATVVDGHTVYVRRTVPASPEELEDLEALLLHVDYDDAFVAYLNGVEVARASIGAPGLRPRWDQYADGSHEASLYQGGQPEVFDLADHIGLLVAGDNVLALELHDISPNSSDTSLIPFLTLGFSSARPGRQSEHLRLPNQWLHTSFAISADGETLTLTLPDGCEVDRVETGPLPADVSLGRAPDGGPDLGYFVEPTPGAPNDTESRRGFAPAPTMVPPPGFHPAGVSVTVGAPPPASVYLTLDGSEPGPDDPVVDGPVVVGPEPEVVVIRARAYEDGAWPSPISTGTYLVAEPPTLPTLSLVTEPANLWDQDTGIYVFGDSYQPNVPYHGANFWEDWERPIHAELWEPDGEAGFSLDCGVKIHGGWSRAHRQKSLRLMTRPGYGARAIEYPLFEGLGVESFERLILRNSGNDWNGCDADSCSSGTHLRDAVMHGIAAATDLEVLAYRPAVVYLNGEYWGILNLRERPDRQFIESHTGHDDIDLLEAAGGVVEGDSEHYQGLLNVLRTQNVASRETWAAVQRLMDTDNFATYQILQIFYDNRDWPGNNIKFWRPRTDDGRWRWLMYDTDFGLGLRGPEPTYDTLAFALQPDGAGWPNPPWSTELLRALVQNEEFRVDFVNRYADYLNTFLRPEATAAVVERAAAGIAPEMPRHIERWGRAERPGGPALRVDQWEARVAAIVTWLRGRPEHARAHIADSFGLAGTWQLDLRVEPPGSGSFQLTAVSVEAPFSGTYFAGVPVTITAVPAEGFEWDSWSSGPSPREPTVVLSTQDDTSLTARFQ